MPYLEKTQAQMRPTVLTATEKGLCEVTQRHPYVKSYVCIIRMSHEIHVNSIWRQTQECYIVARSGWNHSISFFRSITSLMNCSMKSHAVTYFSNTY